MAGLQPGRPLDVLVVGGGNAALCAVISARRSGASVLVLEGALRFYRDGNTRNMCCAHDSATEILTEPYTEDEFFDDLLRVTGCKTDEGVRFQPSLGAPFFTMPCGKFIHGLYRFLALVRYARERASTYGS